jgi:hypothetical protein
MSFLVQILSALGAVASIVSLYVFMRHRENKLNNFLRRDIVAALASQIREGREISIFEVQAVICSKTREAKATPDSIPINEVIEDLVADTVSNSMLDNGEKERILEILTNLYETARRFMQFKKGGGLHNPQELQGNVK